jgi:hypothetical protein
MPCAWAASFTAELDDAAARAQYAFYTDDARALQDIRLVIEKLDAPAEFAAVKEYQLGFVQWKTAQLADKDASNQQPSRPTGSARGSIGKAAQSCVTHMQAATRYDTRFAEAYAIEALCSGLTAAPTMTVSSQRATVSCQRKILRTALDLEPRNPRVRLIEYLCRNEADEAARFEQLRSTVAAFDVAVGSQPGKPDWGHAEALVLLGQEQISRGDAVAAREALEQALVLAPDYHTAQVLLRTAATPR